MSKLVWECPAAFLGGLPLAAALLAMLGLRYLRAGVPVGRILTSVALRGLMFLGLVLLAARPVRVETNVEEPPRRELCVLLDRSESMSCSDSKHTRFDQAIAVLRDQVIAAARSHEWRIRAFAFAADASGINYLDPARIKADGRRTNLARAVLQSLAASAEPPVAVLALSDGAITDPAENSAALSALVRSRVPFVAVGFGSETPARSISLVAVTAPPVVAPDQPFQVTAQLQINSPDPIAEFDLLLSRDGQLVQQKVVQPGAGSQLLTESFEVRETEEGLRVFAVQLVPPHVPGLLCPRRQGSTSVRIGTDKEIRMLFAQGALTWDYKFIRLALQDDPTLQLAGVTQTSRQAILHQAADESEKLAGGFPSTVEEISQYRVLVLSNFQANQLSNEQQQLVERFCAELGGGVLVMGGPDSLNDSWNGSVLGRLLPVRFASGAASHATQPFRIQLTRESLSHPVFRISDEKTQEAAWGAIPFFMQYAVTDSAKPGAEVWAVHPVRGPEGRPRPIIAVQRYGAGTCAVMGVHTFWRWRLARDGDAAAFDRFWRQLLRYLAETGRDEVLIRVPDQPMASQSEIRLILERPPDPTATAGPRSYQIRVENPQRAAVLEQSLALELGAQHTVQFRTASEGIYPITVRSGDRVVSLRNLEIRDTNIEWERPGRDMETLRQWANLTGGTAVKAEESADLGDILVTAQERLRSSAPANQPAQVSPLGVHFPVLLLLLGFMCTEWAFRKWWDWS